MIFFVDCSALATRRGFYLRDSYRLTKQSPGAGMLKTKGCDTSGCIENRCAIRPPVHLASKAEPHLLFDRLTVELPKGT